MQVFRKITAPLFKWSIKNQCGFHVNIYDRTEPSSKLLYQKLDQEVQNHFYILKKKVKNQKKRALKPPPIIKKKEERSFWGNAFN